MAVVIPIVNSNDCHPPPPPPPPPSHTQWVTQAQYSLPRLMRDAEAALDGLLLMATHGWAGYTTHPDPAPHKSTQSGTRGRLVSRTGIKKNRKKSD